MEVYEELVLFHASFQKPQAFYGQPIKVSSRLTSPDRIDYSSIRLLPARHDIWEKQNPSHPSLLAPTGYPSPWKSKREGWVFLKSSFLVAPHKLYRGEAGLKAIHLGHRGLSPLLSILRLALRHSKWKAWNVMPLFKQPGMQSCKKNIQSRSVQYRNCVAMRFPEDMQYVQQIAW